MTGVNMPPAQAYAAGRTGVQAWLIPLWDSVVVRPLTSASRLVGAPLGARVVLIEAGAGRSESTRKLAAGVISTSGGLRHGYRPVMWSKMGKITVTQVEFEHLHLNDTGACIRCVGQ
eukprot:18566-Eustigmatos_ZCMA.PRE.1